MLSKWLAIPVLIIGLGACTGPDFADFEGSTPAFVPEEYFPGTTRVWGVFEDRFGNIRRQFIADVEGTYDGETLTLDETFTFADGETDTRVWQIRRNEDGSYTGTANDVIGEAVGKQNGQAFNLRYDVAIEVGESSYQVHFNDWLLLQKDGTVFNRAIVTKWGVRVGELSAFYQKIDDEPGS